jgi:hypothetical protein
LFKSSLTNVNLFENFEINPINIPCIILETINGINILIWLGTIANAMNHGTFIKTLSIIDLIKNEVMFGISTKWITNPQLNQKKQAWKNVQITTLESKSAKRIASKVAGKIPTNIA